MVARCDRLVSLSNHSDQSNHRIGYFDYVGHFDRLSDHDRFSHFDKLSDHDRLCEFLWRGRIMSLGGFWLEIERG